MLRSINIIEAYPDLPARIDGLRQSSASGEMDASVTLTTAITPKRSRWKI